MLVSYLHMHQKYFQRAFMRLTVQLVAFLSVNDFSIATCNRKITSGFTDFKISFIKYPKNQNMGSTSIDHTTCVTSELPNSN